jgi:hypothetical protein
MHQLPPAVGQHHEHELRAKGRRRHREEIQRATYDGPIDDRYDWTLNELEVEAVSRESIAPSHLGAADIRR